MCSHEEEQKNLDNLPAFSNQIKATTKIISKMNAYVRATTGELDFHSVGFILSMVMRELNKTKFYGWEKKHLAVFIMAILLEGLGVPEVFAYFSASVLEEMVEQIYRNRMHKFKKSGRCITM